MKKVTFNPEQEKQPWFEEWKRKRFPDLTPEAVEVKKAASKKKTKGGK
jgi:hypothetical protein